MVITITFKHIGNIIGNQITFIDPLKSNTHIGHILLLKSRNLDHLGQFDLILYILNL
jgi:hypothetical protein